MRAFGILGLIAACGPPAVLAPAPPPLRPTPKAAPPAPATTMLTGRVVMDGEPIRYYGVIAAKNYAAATPWDAAKVIRDKDGRFRVPVQAGTWDLVIAGPGFARKVVTGNSVEDGKTRDIGDVIVMHGDTISGVVRDSAGAPVAGAEVSLVSMPDVEHTGALDELAHGNLTTTSGDDGKYVLDDFTLLPTRVTRPRISAATSDHRVSLPVTLSWGNNTVDFVVAPVGVLEVRITGSVQTKIFVRAVGTSGLLVHGTMSGGVYRADAPAGDYDVFVYGAHPPPPAPQRVTVAGGTVASIAVAVTPQPPVPLTVHVVDQPCDEIQLNVIGDDTPVVTARCTGSDAEFPQVEPGYYQVCALGATKPVCAGEHVGTGANQRFELKP